MRATHRDQVMFDTEFGPKGNILLDIVTNFSDCIRLNPELGMQQ